MPAANRRSLEGFRLGFAWKISMRNFHIFIFSIICYPLIILNEKNHICDYTINSGLSYFSSNRRRSFALITNWSDYPWADWSSQVGTHPPSPQILAQQIDIIHVSIWGWSYYRSFYLLDYIQERQSSQCRHYVEILCPNSRNTR